MTPVLYFVRHGQTLWNAERRFQGREEVELDSTGRKQAERNGRQLAEILQDASLCDFVASPQLRARETMEIVRAQLGLPPQDYRTDDRLVEVAYGDWQGLTETDARERFPDQHAERARDKWNFIPPGDGSESYAMQAERFAPLLQELRHSSICVSHGGIMRCVLVLAGGWPSQEAGNLEIPQDRILRLEGHRVDWL